MVDSRPCEAPHFTYDGLGRVVRVQQPEDDDGELLTVTDFYYDGVRPVQEASWTRIEARTVNQTSPTDPGGSQSEFPLPRFAFELDDSQQVQGRAADWADRRLSREYVWAADPEGYVDECVAQLVYTDAHDAPGVPGDDTTPTMLYVLTGPTSTVMGLTDSDGHLAAQYHYTPTANCWPASSWIPRSTTGCRAPRPRRR